MVEGRLTTDAPETELQADARRWGIDPALLEDVEEDEGLWPDHLPALEVFGAICTQWRVIAGDEGALQYIGLDYTAAAAGLGLAGLTVTPEVWADVQLIENGALTALNRNRMQ